MHKPKKIRKTGILRGGVFSLFALSIMFLIGGIIAIIFPITFYSTGGTGMYARTPVATVYDSSQTQIWGVIFVVFAAFFLICAYRLQRGNIRK